MQEIIKGLVALILVGTLAWAAVLVVNRIAEARTEAAVARVNAIADTSHARQVEEIRDGHRVVVGELNARLATSQGEAEEVRARWRGARARAEERGRELASAQRSLARLEARFTEDTATLADPDAGGIREASFEGVLPSRGDTIGYDAELELDFNDHATLDMRVWARLTIDTQMEWEGEQPVCTVEARHRNVAAVPGDCVEVLGDRPVERTKLPTIDLGFLEIPRAAMIGVGAGLLIASVVFAAF